MLHGCTLSRRKDVTEGEERTDKSHVPLILVGTSHFLALGSGWMGSGRVCSTTLRTTGGGKSYSVYILRPRMSHSIGRWGCRSCGRNREDLGRGRQYVGANSSTFKVRMLMLIGLGLGELGTDSRRTFGSRDCGIRFKAECRWSVS